MHNFCGMICLFVNKFVTIHLVSLNLMFKYIEDIYFF